MNILLFQAGFHGDIIVVGQNFTRELRERYPHASIDLMLCPKMRGAEDLVEPLSLYRRFLFGEREDFRKLKHDYDLAFMIDERVYPEGNLRTIFTISGFPFRQHRLTLVTTAEDDWLASDIVRDLKRPIIATQDDMARKWPQGKVEELRGKLRELGSLLVVGPKQVFPGLDRPLTFRESAALLRQVDIFVGIDSGIAHAAALVGTQTVLLPPVFPENWISPTEYANPFIAEEPHRHISVRPPQSEFCGHYFCLRPTATGGIARRCGDPLRVKCVWKKRWGLLKGPCCFTKISVDDFYQSVLDAMNKRNA